MKRALRLLSFVAALAAGSLTLSACDASPYAATVNGQVITVNSLNHQLAMWAANPQWVQGYNQSNSQAQGGNGTTVAGAGSGTYSSQFVAEILTLDAQSIAVHQHLAATGNPANDDEVIASRAVNEYLRAAYWAKFPPALRDFLVQQLADEGALAQPPSDPTQLQGPYSQIQPYLFSQICVVQASAFSSDAAQAIISSGVVNGVHVCYDQISLEAHPPAYQSAVIKLANPGDISSPLQTSYGFVVVKLVSRTGPGFDPAVQRVLVAATSQVAAVGTILGAAHVKVNPRYGYWSNGQVNPPPAPLSS